MHFYSFVWENVHERDVDGVPFRSLHSYNKLMDNNPKSNLEKWDPKT